jgi:hypothetical protein
MFKVGDRVECVNGSLSYITKGKVYEVLSVSEDWVRVLDDKGKEDGWDERNFKLVTPPLNICSGMTYEEAQELQPGDKVKVLFAANSHSRCPHSGRKWRNGWFPCHSEVVGRSLVVTEIDEFVSREGVAVSRRGSRPYMRLPWFCLQLVEKAQQVEEMTLEAVCKELGREIKIVKGE